MSPQHSSSTQAYLRWRDGLQANYCTDYSLLHNWAFIINRLARCNPPSFGYLSRRYTPRLTCARIDDSSSLYPVSNIAGVTPLNDPPRFCRSARKQFAPTDKKETYNRMNGSPGDPPGTHMHKFKPKRITPFIHRLVSDPIGMEAGWETLT
mgnify:FL=1